jgi:hypothetical protein
MEFSEQNGPHCIELTGEMMRQSARSRLLREQSQQRKRNSTPRWKSWNLSEKGRRSLPAERKGVVGMILVVCSYRGQLLAEIDQAWDLRGTTRALGRARSPMVANGP